VRNCLISTSGLFLDPDFLRDAGIPAIREHYGQKLIKENDDDDYDDNDDDDDILYMFEWIVSTFGPK